MITDAQIKDLKQYAANLLRGREDIDPEDIVQDSLLTLFETGKDFYFIQAKATVKDRVFRNKLIENRNEVRTFADSETTKHCKGCNEDLLINAFYLFRSNKKNIESLSHLCKKCHNKATHKNTIGKRKISEDARLKYNSYHKEYKKKKQLEKEFASKQYLKNAHAILEWRKSA